MSRLPSRAAQVTLWVLVWSGPPVPPGQPVRLGRHHLHGLSKRNVGQPAPPRTTRGGRRPPPPRPHGGPFAVGEDPACRRRSGGRPGGPASVASRQARAPRPPRRSDEASKLAHGRLHEPKQKLGSEIGPPVRDLWRCVFCTCSICQSGPTESPSLHAPTAAREGS
jgi:hypothetical protein